jgi:pyridoxal phosphate enzyme (YggS family)
MAGVTHVGAEAVASRLAEVRRRVARAGGDPTSIRIVAVTKGFEVRTVEAALAAGLPDVGENYAQELVAKAGQTSAPARWHFLGPVQRNKVKRLAPLVTVWHGIDRAVAADAVAAARPGVEVLVQVNLTGQAGRPGCRPEDVDDLVRYCRQRPISLSGLMAIGPEGDLDRTRSSFAWLARRARQLGLRELSMGMSDDFEVAVAEGATTLRLGRVLFGPRPEAVTKGRVPESPAAGRASRLHEGG